MLRIGVRQGKKIEGFPGAVPAVDDLVVTVLTGGRPILLEQTLDALERHAGPRLRRWTVLALVNGADAPTMAVLTQRPWVTSRPVEGPIRPIGAALSDLMGMARHAGRAFLLHLEDDWSCSHAPERWLDRGAYALGNPRVGQVRLRSSADQVSRTNMCTGAAIRWSFAPDHLRSSNAHFTFNPHLVRCESIPKIYPCDGELDAQRKFAQTHLDVVQILPGSFSHVGGQSSLRENLGRGHGP